MHCIIYVYKNATSLVVQSSPRTAKSCAIHAEAYLAGIGTRL